MKNPNKSVQVRTFVILLAAIASSCHKQQEQNGTADLRNPTPAKNNALGVHLQEYAGRYVRGGDWRRIRTSSVGPYGLVATDRQGTRLLLLRPNAGYDVYIADLGCNAPQETHIEQGRGASTDEAAPSEPSRPPAGVEFAIAAQGLCSGTTAPRHETLLQAVRTLRGTPMPNEHDGMRMRPIPKDFVR